MLETSYCREVERSGKRHAANRSKVTYSVTKEFEELFIVNMAQSSEITGIDFDSNSSRLAICNRLGCVQLFSLNSDMSIKTLFSILMDNVLPKAIAFGSMFSSTAGGSGEQKLLVFSLHDGSM